MTRRRNVPCSCRRAAGCARLDADGSSRGMNMERPEWMNRAQAPSQPFKPFAPSTTRSSSSATWTRCGTSTRRCSVFSLQRVLSSGWIEFRIGSNTLALAMPSRTASDHPIPVGSAALQLAFKVSVAEVDACAEELVRKGISLVSPPTDQVFGHRTLFFRDPDGNLLEVFADIQVPPMLCT